MGSPSRAALVLALPLLCLLSGATMRAEAARMFTIINKCETTYCCRGKFGGPSTCPPTPYSKKFKEACPSAYSYAYDDPSSLFQCSGADYVITFCANRFLCFYQEAIGVHAPQQQARVRCLKPTPADHVRHDAAGAARQLCGTVVSHVIQENRI
ncbi:unnamed protein product [Triticum turgidum subsp. durum]|uniref:Acidic protein n=1 Tax=Triticum turgidum subsp. durum TaxID=4567 RepID=A0A9R0XVV7_TRITD|nr:unnamed protein product [Triticum turgidum subsp. durum]